jgi:hypothetical protein
MNTKTFLEMLCISRLFSEGLPLVWYFSCFHLIEDHNEVKLMRHHSVIAPLLLPEYLYYQRVCFMEFRLIFYLIFLVVCHTWRNYALSFSLRCGCKLSNLFHTQNYWVFGLCPSSGFELIRRKRKTRRFIHWICLRPQVRGDTYSVGSFRKS